MLDYIVVPSEPPRISPARGPSLWEDCDAHNGEGAQVEPDWILAEQPTPDYEVDQRVNWSKKQFYQSQYCAETRFSIIFMLLESYGSFQPSYQ